MAKMTCKCGEALSDTSVPNDMQLWVYTDKEWDMFTTPETLETWSIPAPPRDMWMCPSCKRLYIFKKGEDKAFMTYKIEID